MGKKLSLIATVEVVISQRATVCQYPLTVVAEQTGQRGSSQTKGATEKLTAASTPRIEPKSRDAFEGVS